MFKKSAMRTGAGIMSLAMLLGTAGLIPARVASKKDPVIALRTE